MAPLARVIVGAAALVAAAGAGGGGAVSAEEATEAPAAPAPTAVKQAAPSHRGQILGSVRAALGLRGIATYDDDAYCGTTDTTALRGFAPVCTGRAPFSLDFELGYGATSSIDVFLELRVGLESDFGANPAAGGPRVFHLAPGARVFFSESGRTRLFTTAQLVLDFTGYTDSSGAGRGTDLGVRNLSGVWVDLDRAYGVYAFIGETATFSRWLRFELEAGIGFQGRYR